MSGALAILFVVIFAVDVREIGSGDLAPGPGTRAILDVLGFRGSAADRESSPSEAPPLVKRIQPRAAAPRPDPEPSGDLPPAEIGEPAEQGLPPPASFGGRILDAETGAGVPDARLFLAAYHGSPERDLAGLATIRRVQTTTAADGSFEVPALAPEDPRLLLHLQVEHGSYTPRTAVLQHRDGPDGRWRAMELRLRPAITAPVEIVTADDRPVRDVLVRITPYEILEDLLDADQVAITTRGRLSAPVPAEVFFVDSTQPLRLPLGDTPYDIELLDPRFQLATVAGEGSGPDGFSRGSARITIENTSGVVLRAIETTVAEHVLYDAAGEPIAESPIEIAAAGMPPLRVLTGPGGEFRVGWIPLDDGTGLTLRNPIAARITTLAPEFFGRVTELALPSAGDPVVAARPAGLMRLRLARRSMNERVHADGDRGDRGAGDSDMGGSDVDGEATLPVEPHGVRISIDATLERWSPDGMLELRGAYPPPGTEFGLYTRGYLPQRIVFAGQRDAEGAVDLGTVTLEPGWQMDTEVRGLSGAMRRGAELVARFLDDPLSEQRYRLDAAETIQLGGLRPGQLSVSVERFEVVLAADVVVITEETRHRTLVLEATDADDNVQVSGVLHPIAPRDIPGVRVLEELYVEGEKDPHVFGPYRIAPDGGFASSRRLPDVESVRVHVRGPNGWYRSVTSRREPRRPAVFDLGVIRLAPRPIADVSFFVEGLGRVDPPLRVALDPQGATTRLHQFRVHGRNIVIDSVYRGRYRLRWRGVLDSEEVLSFEVPSTVGRGIKVNAERAPLQEESIEILVVDSTGSPIPASYVQPPGFSFLGHLSLDPGVKLTRVIPRATTRFSVGAEGYVSAHVEVPSGGTVPQRISLYRPACVRGRLRTPEGDDATGLLTVSWRREEKAPVTYGRPVTVEVPDGRFEVCGLPPLRRRFSFQLDASAVTVSRELALPETAPFYELGELVLRETRTLRGVVLQPNGLPAANADVALAHVDETRRYPLRRPMELTRQRYRARADSQGVFQIEGLPVPSGDSAGELPAELALVARLDGFGDAVEHPVDLDREAHELVLEYAAGVDLSVGYRDGRPREHYRFALEHRDRLGQGEPPVELGEIAPESYGVQRFRGVEPGWYRVTWGLREFYDPLPQLWEDIEVRPGEIASLRMVLEGHAVTGTARFNGRRMESGWILVTNNPGDAGSTRAGYVAGGKIYLLDPPDGLRGYAALIPAGGKPQPLQNVRRGEALPVQLRNYRSALRRGRLDVDYEAYSLTIQFSPDFLAEHPDAVLSFPHYSWKRDKFHGKRDDEPILDPTVYFHLLRRGLHRISVRTPRGKLIVHRNVLLDRDLTVEIR